MADYDVPTMEVGFAIETGASFDELTRLTQIMESTEGKVLAEAARIEQATGGMVKLGGATSQFTTFGNAASRELANVARDTNRAEKAGEGMVRQLERQIEVFGKSASEIRQMRAEMKAVAAESQGLTELAGRLRAASAEITRMEHASRGAAGSSNASRAAVQNLGFQVQDFAVQVVGGTSALRAFAMQAPQAAGTLTGFGGVVGRVGGFLAGPWGIALTVATTLLAGFAAEALETSDTLDKVKFSSNAVGDAQSILGGVLDITTGKVINQSGALMGLARAQLAVARVQAQARQAEARAQIKGAGQLGLMDGLYGAFSSNKTLRGSRATQNVMQAFLQGGDDLKKAQGNLEYLNEAGLITVETFAKATAAVANFAVEGENLKVYDSAGRILDGVGTALDKGLILRAPKATKATKDLTDAIEKQRLAWIAWVQDTRMTAMGNVQKLAADIHKQNLEWKQAEQTVGEKMIEQEQDRANLREAEKQGQQEILDLYLRQLDVIQQIGGAAGTVAALLSGLATGNFAGVGGDFGRLLNSASTVIGKDGWKQVTNKLDSLFGSAGDGSFAASISSGLGAFSFAVEANKMIGNIFGFKGGPLGIFTSMFDSVVNPSRSAGATLTSGSGYSIGGKDKKQYGVAEGLGDSVLGGLNQIASALGVTIGSFNTTLGIRDGDYRVNTDGTSLKLKNGAVDFGDDADAAIKYAIADAIKDGALMGLRASTQALLKAGDDIEVQLEKALQFESVFTELKAMTDPVGAAIDTLDKQFAQLRDVFAEAGASAAEYADLEQLYQLKKVEAIKQANSEALELSRDRRTLEARILELQGKDLQAVAMLRQIEIEQMDDSLRPLQQRVWAMEDATTIIEKMQPLVDSLQDYRDTLFGQDDGALSYRTALLKLMETGGLAAGGDATALGNLQGVSQDFLTSARNNASSMAQYQRDVAMVARYVDGGIGAAQGQIDVAQATLDATNASVLLLSSIDDTLSAAADAASASTGSATGSASTTADLAARIDALAAELAQMRADNNAGHAATAGGVGAIKRHWDNVTAASGGDAIATIPGA